MLTSMQIRSEQRRSRTTRDVMNRCTVRRFERNHGTQILDRRNRMTRFVLNPYDATLNPKDKITRLRFDTSSPKRSSFRTLVLHFFLGMVLHNIIHAFD